MPWRIYDLMSQRLEFVLLAQQEGMDLRELCRRFGISPKTGWKWRRRFAEGGPAALEDLSRRPHRSPRQVDPALADKVIAARQQHPTWGGRKLRGWLNKRGAAPAPAASTCTEILRRADLLGAAPTRRPFQRFERAHPNQLWQMDHKGHFPTQSGERCHPLTVLDDCSRFDVVLAAHPDERGPRVQGALTVAFTMYGVPDAMLFDNGPPWGCADATCPYTTLGVWLLRVGITVLHGRPYHPQTQGKDERFHRTLNNDLISRHTWSDLEHCRREFARYRDIYNCERPHDMLGGATPIERYQPSVRAFPSTLPPIEYPAGTTIKALRETGLLTFGGQTWYVGRAFGRLPIGLRPSARDGRWVVYFMHHPLGLIDLTTAKLPKHTPRSIYEDLQREDLLPPGEADRLPWTPSAQSEQGREPSPLP